MNTSATHSVRRATGNDLDVLAHLRYAFRAANQTSSETESDFIMRCTQWMRPRIASASHWRVWLLEQADAPIGNVWLQIVEKIPNPGDEPEFHAYLSNLYVYPEVRNSGGGSALLNAALSDCRAAGVDTVFLWPSAKSRPLYERHGFRVADDLLVNKL